MSPHVPRPGGGGPGDAGLTLIEAVTTTVIALVLAAAVGTAAHVILSADEDANTQTIVGEIGLALLEEALTLPFEDPEAPSATLGPEAGEFPTVSRALFDDVDDYAAWDGTATLQTKDGKPIASPYRRRVDVTYVTPDSFTVTSLTPTNHKRVLVTVTDTLGVEQEHFQALRARGGRVVDVPF